MIDLKEEARKLHETLGCKEDVTFDYIQVVLENIQLFDKKQHDYGSGNIAQFGQFGVLVRISDKLNRLINLSKKDKPAFTLESIEDTWRDIHVYGAIGLLCHEGKWPGVVGYNGEDS